MGCPDCGHPAHPDEFCDVIPWDGNPYGYDCACPPADHRRRARQRSLSTLREPRWGDYA